MLQTRWHLSLLLLTVASPVTANEAATVTLTGESRQAAARLDEARKRLADGKPAEAAAVLQAVIDGAAGDLVPAGTGRLLAAAHVARGMLLRLDPAQRQAQRRRIDAQARRWLEQAERSGEEEPLHRLVREAFLSAQALTALDRLGDRAFSRGAFDRAEAWWAQAAPLERPPPDAPVYPDPPAELAARLQAKQVLARLFRGHAGAAADVQAYRRRHPAAAGTLAGRTGLYADTLAAVAKDLPGDLPLSGDWPTFAGSPTRNRVAPASPQILNRLSLLCRSGPTWRFDLEQRRLQDDQALPPPRGPGSERGEVDEARQLAFFPVVLGSLALVADARYVTAYDLRSGKANTWYDAAAVVGGLRPKAGLPAPADLRYSLTVAEGAVFARLGSQTVRDIRRTAGQPERVLEDGGESILVALALTPGPDGDRRRWMVRAVDPGRREFAVFEGAPLVQDGRVFIAATRFEGDRVVTAIHCYAAHPEDSVAPLLWRTDVVESRELLPATAADADTWLRQRSRQHLLTVAGSQVFYCSHSGAVVALEVGTGQRRWAVRTPRQTGVVSPDEPHLHDLAPCVHAEGRLYVAPSDSDRLLCLDPENGATLWEREGLDIVHLAGVASGRVIFTTWRQPSQGRLFAGGLRALDARDGSDRGGWSLPDDGGGLLPMGRPLLLGDLVLWPTARRPYGVFAVRQIDGLQPDNPALLHRIPAGNLIYANDCLLVADGLTLHAFVPPELRPDEPLVPPKGQTLHQALDRSLAAAARGDHAGALQRLTEIEHALERTPAGHHRREQTRQVAATRRRLVLDGLHAAIATGRLSDADRALETARQDAAPADELAALTGAARPWTGVAPERAAACWRVVVGRADLRDLPLPDEAGLPQRASLLAAAHLARLRPERSGAGVTAFMAALSAARRGTIAVELAERYPEVDSVRAALREQAVADETADRFAAAALGWVRLLSLAHRPDEEAAPRAALARLWERMDCPGAARTVRRQRATDSVPRPSPAWFPPRAVHDLTLTADEDFLPLITGEGPLAELLLVSRPGEIVAGGAGDESCRWRGAVPFAPGWASGFGTLLLLGGGEGLVALDGTSGSRLWGMSAGLGSDAAFTAFHLHNGRIIVVQGERRLLCLDALTGRVLWQRPAPGAALAMPAPRGRFQHVVPLGDERLLVQTCGRRWLIDAATGRLLDETPTPLAAWPRPPLPLGPEALCLVPDAGRIELIDATTGRCRWSHVLSGGSLLSGEPPLALVAGSELLIVEPLNIGCRLARLDRATGRLLARGPLVRPGRIDPDAWAADGQRVWCAEAGRLHAFAVADGRPRWDRPLPEADGWRLTRQANTLFAWPVESGIRFRFAWLPGTVQYFMGPLPVPSDWSLQCFDADSGDLLARFPVGEHRPRVRLDRRGVGVAWPSFDLARVNVAPRVRIAGDRLLFAVGGRLRVLRQDSPPSSK